MTSDVRWMGAVTGTRMVLRVAGLLGLAVAIGCSPVPEVGNFQTGVAIGIESPERSRTVAEGTPVTVAFYTFREGFGGATVTMVARNQDTREELTLLAPQAVPSGRSDQEILWDTTGAGGGSFEIFLRMLSGSEELRSETADGVITVDGAPTFAFTAPADDAVLGPGGEVRIAFRAQDAEADAEAQILLDPDDDPTNGNEVTLAREVLPAAEAVEEIVFEGIDEQGTAVTGGTYRLVAIVSDEAHDAQVIDAGVEIEVQ